MSWRYRQLQGRVLEGMGRNGYSAEFEQRCFAQIQSFGTYGFPEAHASSFARPCLCVLLSQMSSIVLSAARHFLIGDKVYIY
jgi:hypothetical protein